MKDEPLRQDVLDHGGDQFLAEMVLLNARLKRTRRRELAFRGGVLVLILVIVLVVSGLRATVERQNADRAAARVAACVNANKERAQVRAAIVTTADSSVRAVIPPHPTPDQAAKVQPFLDAYHAGAEAGVKAGLPDRDCSPTGIAAYYRPRRSP